MLPHISTIELQKLASGDIFSLQVYRFVGHNTGKKVYIQANLHGAEVVGNAVIYRLIDWLSGLDDRSLTGEIWLVPVCNPLGINQRSHFFATGRYNHYDGKDWNRIFWNYEKQGEDLSEFARSTCDLPVATIRQKYLDNIYAAWKQQEQKIQQSSYVPFSQQYRYRLQSLCLDANYTIDIHSSSNQSIDYLYCFQGREDSAKYFLLDKGILMKEYDGDTFDEAFLKPWIALEKELQKMNRKVRFDLESWTLELGSGMQINPKSVAKGVEGIKNYLAYHKIINCNSLPSLGKKTKAIIFTPKSQLKNYYSPTGGMIHQRVDLNTQVKAGDFLYQILSFNKQGKLPELVDICAENDGLVFDISTSQTVNQGEYVLGMMNH
jgi:predicted deacylase